MCDSQVNALRLLAQQEVEICSLEANASQTLFEFTPKRHVAYVLGNETEGVSKDVVQLADKSLSIPMNNGVESLNVAVTASLIAFAGSLAKVR